MSKTQDKKEQRLKEAHEFVAERRKIQLAMLEQAYQIGLKLYEDNKDKLSPEDAAQIERMRDDQLATLERLKSELNTGTEA